MQTVAPEMLLGMRVKAQKTTRSPPQGRDDKDLEDRDGGADAENKDLAFVTRPPLTVARKEPLTSLLSK